MLVYLTFWCSGKVFCFTKTAITREQKVEKSSPRWEMTPLSEGYKWALDQNRGKMAKSGCLGQNWNFGPKPKKGTKKQFEKFALVVFPLYGYQNFYLLPWKLGFLAHKRPNFAFLAKYWHFWLIWSHGRPKTDANKVPRWFFCSVGTKTFAFSRKNLDFWPKKAKFGPKSAFMVILGQILPFFAHFVQCPTKKQCEEGA